MIKKLIFFLIALGALVYFLNSLHIVDINLDFKASLFNISNGKDAGVVLTYSAPLPDEVFYKSLAIGRDASQKTNKNVTVLGFINITEPPQPLVKMNFKSGELVSVEDIRSDWLKIISDLWIYDFLPENVSVDDNEARISFYHFGNYSSFKEDLMNVALNIFEDTGVERIKFTLLGNEPQHFTISQEDIFSGFDNSSPNQAACASSKEEAYRAFVRAYNAVVDAQQKGDDNLIKKAYEEYQKARACYESFSSN